MMENHWVSNDTDRIHRLVYDPGQAYPVKKIVLYHIKCNVLIDYTIQGRRDSLQRKDLYRDGQPRWNYFLLFKWSAVPIFSSIHNESLSPRERRRAAGISGLGVSHFDAFSLSNAAVTIPFFSCRS